MRKLLHSRVAAVSVGAVVAVGFGTTGAVAANLIGSNDIRNQSIRGVDIARGTIDSSELGDQSVRAEDLNNDSIGASELRPDAVRRNHLDPSLLTQVDNRSEVNGLRDRVVVLEQSGDATAPNTVGHLLHGTPTETTTVTYEFEEPVALGELTKSGALSFFQERLLGSGQYGVSLVLGVDVDGSGGYESDDRAWGAGPDGPVALGDDTFVAMDGTNPDTVRVDAPQVKHWWSPNQAGDGFENVDANCYNDLETLFLDCTNVRFDANSTVEIVRFTMGGTPAWTDEAVRFTVLDERLSLVSE